MVSEVYDAAHDTPGIPSHRGAFGMFSSGACFFPFRAAAPVTNPVSTNMKYFIEWANRMFASRN